MWVVTQNKIRNIVTYIQNKCECIIITDSHARLVSSLFEITSGYDLLAFREAQVDMWFAHALQLVTRPSVYTERTAYQILLNFQQKAKPDILIFSIH